MRRDDLDALLAEQIAYYRARAGEYDRTSPLAYDVDVRGELAAALEAFAPRGEVLELACGTGEWTAELARHATRLTAVDASPEMLALNHHRVGAANVRYLPADLFAWTPPARYDVVFFSAWLTHVPPQRFDTFWALVAACLNDQGRVFVIDELPAVAAHERVIADAPAPSVERELETGARYRTVESVLRPGHADSEAGRTRVEGGDPNHRLAVLLRHRPPHQRSSPRWRQGAVIGGHAGHNSTGVRAACLATTRAGRLAVGRDCQHIRRTIGQLV